ncbi:hypothetical protein QN277_019662 [Acacia crassicarpa]|uniref:acid phosphatase n=1 Tax=Acacia crassicarpa TaxID=499986 RepID=A0AAE1JHX6_9FABA|nr:hypothetical protein QN277_019662 [Acacia crassicarpa]
MASSSTSTTGRKEKARRKGNKADPRTRAASKRRGIEITSISRPIQPSDFREFDLILAMDKQNRENILEASIDGSLEILCPLMHIRRLN